MPKKTRPIADVLGTYGAGILPGPVDYETFCGLVFSLPRVEMRRAVAVARGVWAALTDQDLGPEWGEAMALDEAGAREALWRTNAARQEMRALARKGLV